MQVAATVVSAITRVALPILRATDPSTRHVEARGLTFPNAVSTRGIETGRGPLLEATA